MTTETPPHVRDLLETRPFMVAYWDQFGRPVGYTSHHDEAAAERAATNTLGKILSRTGALVTLARFHELDTETMTYTYNNNEMEF